jgi:hypothetical protein
MSSVPRIAGGMPGCRLGADEMSVAGWRYFWRSAEQSAKKVVL